MLPSVSLTVILVSFGAFGVGDFSLESLFVEQLAIKKTVNSVTKRD
jgi:hypothetical protein